MKLICPVCGMKLDVNKNYNNKIIECDFCNTSLFVFKKDKKIDAIAFSLDNNIMEDIEDYIDDFDEF